MGEHLHDAGADPDLLTPEIGRYWIAFQFDTDVRAKQAWEKIHDEVQWVSCWRTRHPVHPPHDKFAVWTMGERQDLIEAAEAICVAAGGTPTTPDDPYLITSLRLRRQDHAINALVQGSDATLRTVLRNEDGFRMSREGKIIP